MRSTRLLVLLTILAWVLSSCGNSKKKEDVWVAPEHESVTREMPELHVLDSTKTGNHRYTYEILRTATDSLPKVKDDMDDFYRDNTIRLTLWRDGAKYFDKTFTKAVFASSIDEPFYQNAILDGIRFLQAEPGQGLTFSFAVSYPESDMSMPFLLTVTDQGTFSFVKDDNLDVEKGDTAYYDSDGV